MVLKQYHILVFYFIKKQRKFLALREAVRPFTVAYIHIDLLGPKKFNARHCGNQICTNITDAY